MTTALMIAIASGLVAIGSFGLGHLARKVKAGAFQKQMLCDLVGVVLALSLLVCVEALLHHSQGMSFFELIRMGAWSYVVLPVLVAGMVQGIIYEYIGQLTYPLWYYPQAQRLRVLLLGLPLFWGIFMLILQDTWALLRGWGAEAWLAVLLTALIHLAIIEGINMLIHSWKYRGLANTPYFLVPGWIILVLTFVVLNNRYFVNPFGF